NTISWLLPRSSSPVRLQNRAKIRHFLMARGVRIEGNETPHSDQKIRALLDKVVQHVEQYKKAIRSLNYYAYTAYASLKSKPLKESGDDFWTLIDLFKGSGLLRVEDDCLVFRDEKARFFANGGWLEEFLFYQIKQLFGSMPELQDNLCGVKWLDESRGVKNEIDNLFLYQNKLHLIECKTKRFKKDGQPDGGVVQAIYKLDSLMDAFGGLLSRGMVVSVFDFTEADKERAKSYGIKTVTLLELKDMQHHLKNWMLQG
ncbi:MAG: DUF1887 family CARF protein, partial [Thiomicrorhabdus sp.]|nr:DUF1887 family CARF protein [Thiomicrorhabdus sp.]